ncbi:MAG: DUF2334 domain-containing protein [Verrucomicrobia subdivision 3 bacterium]|nr:DUF2334 domain-containing protein [Limisphaerales bacterium]
MRPIIIFVAILSALALARAQNRLAAGGGPDARTLLIYADTRAKYSMSEGLEILRLQLRRVATRLESVAASNAEPAEIASADYVVVFCPQVQSRLPTNVLHALTHLQKPLLWVGFGADQLQESPPFKGHFEFFTRFTEKSLTNVVYRGKTWRVPVYPWIPARVSSNSAAKILMTVQERVHQRPLVWQLSNATFVATVPLWGPLSYIFSDLLLDFYDVKDIPPSRLLLRVEDYHARSDHAHFRRIADYLYSRRIPYAVSTTPLFFDRESDTVETLADNPELVDGLRYAQRRGARLVMKGTVFDDGRIEFWDTQLDRPLANDSIDQHRERLHRALQQMFRHELLPLAWQTPGYAASRHAYTAIADVFSTAVERVQLSDATFRESYVTSALSADRYGRLIVPENAGYALNSESNSFAGIGEMTDFLAGLRGVVAGSYVHCYQPLEKIIALIDLLQTYNLHFLDLAELDNIVSVPGAILLTGGARKTLELQNVIVHRRSFDRAGRLVAQETERSAASGQRTLERQNGDYNLIELVTPTP